MEMGKILHVDDDEDIRNYVGMLLESNVSHEIVGCRGVSHARGQDGQEDEG